MNHYYEIAGQLKEEFKALQERNNEGHKQARLFSRRVGGHRTKISFFSYVVTHSFAIIFRKEPDLSLWRHPGRGKNKDTTCWVPRLSSKKGRELDTEIRKICELIPTHEDYGKLIGMDLFTGPGVRFVEDRVFVEVPGTVKPKVDMIRISDIQFEQIAGKGKKDV